MTEPLRIAYLTSEVSPFSKTGGLADVSGTLPAALAGLGHTVTVVTPLYGIIDRVALGLRIISGRGEIPGLGGTEIWEGRLKGSIGEPGVRVLFLGAAAFDRPGIYQENGKDYPDNEVRFSFFSRAALALLKHLGVCPDVIHANDWQTALAPIYLKTTHGSDEFFGRTGSVLSIHNLAYQGVFDAGRWRALDLPSDFFRATALEYYGKINFLKGGILFSDLLSTVSPRYAQEIQTRSGGCGLDGVLSARRQTLVGVLNGIDYAEWNPGAAGGLFPPYDADRLDVKREARKRLLEKFGIPIDNNGRIGETPILGCVTRLDPQKGCDLLLRALFRILPGTPMYFVLLGSGSKDLESGFTNLARQFPEKVCLALRFDPELAKVIYAGSDFFAMPSKYEPCGLGQMIAMAYGTIPVVRLIGGLADTVRPFNERTLEGNGFGITSYTANALVDALTGAFHVYHQSPGTFRILQQNAMRERFTWEEAARQYVDLYQRAMRIRREGGGGDMVSKVADRPEAVSLMYEIGESAGKVYQHLLKKSEGDSLEQISKGAGLEMTVSALAIGWLARENNVVVERNGRKVQARLIRR